MSATWLLLGASVPESGGGGITRYLSEFAGAMSARPDIELHVTAARGTEEHWERILGRTNGIHRMAGSGAAQAALERAGVGSSAFRRSFDVVHGAKHILPRRPRGMGVLTVHDFLVLDRPGDFGRLKRQLLARPYLESVRTADRLICVSHATRTRLLDYVPRPQGSVGVVPHSAAGRLHDVPSVPVKGLDAHGFALVVGDASARKNLQLVLAAWPEVHRALPDSRLVIAGPPTRGDEHAGVGPGIIHAGFLSDEELRWCYENAAVVLCPSLMEGFGLPAAEAASFGTPLVTTEDPALCEVSPPHARHVYSRDVSSWSRVMAEALRSPLRHASLKGRTWSDVVAETIDEVFA